MNEKRFVLIFILTIMFLINTGQSATLTLKECLHRAQQHSYRFKADEYLTKSAQQNYLVERSRTLPRFYGELSLEQRNLSSYNFRQQWAQVHGDWALGDFLLKTAHAAQQDALMVEAQKNQTELLVSRRAALLYINILQNQTQANLLQKRFELLQAHHDIARALWQSGTRNQFDLLQTESELSQLQEQKATLEIEHENLWVELARLIDWKNSDTVQLSPIDAADLCAQSLPEMSQNILISNPLLQALSFQIKAQKIRNKAVTAQQLPHLHVAGGRLADGDPTGDGNYWQVNAGFQLPLFLWGASKFQRQQSQAIIHSLEFQKQAVNREITIHVQQTLEKLKKLKNLFLLQRKRLKTNKKAFQFAEANYQAGLITNLDYLSAQQQLTETQIAIEKSQLEYVENLIEFYVTTNQMDKLTEIE